MDPRFLKWMGQALTMTASNLEAVESGGAGFERFRQGFEAMGIKAPPFTGPEMENLYREWLRMMGAVPVKDYEDLEKKYEKLSAECEMLRRALDELGAAIGAVKEAPELLKPWIELARSAGEANVRLFEKWRKVMSEMSVKPDKPDQGGSGE